MSRGRIAGDNEKDIEFLSSDSDEILEPKHGKDHGFVGTLLLVSALALSLVFLGSVYDLDYRNGAALAKGASELSEDRLLIDPTPDMYNQSSDSGSQSTYSSVVKPENESEMWKSVVAPPVDTSPPNVCAESEELFENLCYKECALLTGGEFPVRRTSNACSKVSGEVSVKGLFCEGYQVASDDQCPHPPLTGSCDDNEELHLGKCYRTCKSLTNREYPIRAAANTCCKKKPCFNPFHLKTRGIGCDGFGLGGGQHGHTCPHVPDAGVLVTQVV